MTYYSSAGSRSRVSSSKRGGGERGAGKETRHHLEVVFVFLLTSITLQT